MRGAVTKAEGGLRVRFELSRETWFWRDVGGGLFEEAELLERHSGTAGSTHT